LEALICIRKTLREKFVNFFDNKKHIFIILSRNNTLEALICIRKTLREKFLEEIFHFELSSNQCYQALNEFATLSDLSGLGVYEKIIILSKIM
jgi:hypothetical protein